MPTLEMKLPGTSYPILVKAGALAHAGELFSLSRRVLVLTECGVPGVYAAAIETAVRTAGGTPTLLTLPQGEGTKSPAFYFRVLSVLLENGFTRGDCVVCVGGGVIGDLGGFAAATYLRGIDFYQVPTTLLAAVDASVGGKTAIDFGGYKNTVGAFHQPRGVLIDPELQSSLPARQVASGMAEVIKSFAIADEASFRALEAGALSGEEMILAALRVKQAIVTADERESGVRRALNFGHTVGHAVESVSAAGEHPLFHGEAVALGMLALSDGAVRSRIASLCTRWGLPTAFECREADFRAALLHDKKAGTDGIMTVRVREIGRFSPERTGVDEIVAESREVIRFL